MTATRRLFGRVLTPLLLLVTTAGLVQAEIGALVPTGSGELQPRRPWKFVIIVDDPEPIGGLAWQPYTLPAAGHTLLNPGGYENGDGEPSIAVNPVSGLSIVTWAQNGLAGYDVVYSTLTENGWTQPAILADSSLDELDPMVVVDPADGSVHVFYWVDDATPRVMHRQAPADLSSWSSSVQVSDPADRACRPWGVVFEDELRVVYEVEMLGAGQTPRNIVLSRYDEPSGQFVPEVIAASNHTGELHPRVRSHSGVMWVEWIDADDEVAWVRWDGQGQWELPRYESFQSNLERWLVRAGLRLKAVTVP